MTISSASSSRAARMVRAGRSSGRARWAPLRIERNAGNGSATSGASLRRRRWLSTVPAGENMEYGAWWSAGWAARRAAAQRVGAAGLGGTAAGRVDDRRVGRPGLRRRRGPAPGGHSQPADGRPAARAAARAPLGGAGADALVDAGRSNLGIGQQG